MLKAWGQRNWLDWDLNLALRKRLRANELDQWVVEPATKPDFHSTWWKKRTNSSQRRWWTNVRTLEKGKESEVALKWHQSPALLCRHRTKCEWSPQAEITGPASSATMGQLYPRTGLLQTTSQVLFSESSHMHSLFESWVKKPTCLFKTRAEGA